MKLKLRIGRPTAEHLRAVISYAGIHHNTSSISNAFMHEQMKPIFDKLFVGWTTKKKTFTITASQIYCIYQCAIKCATDEVYEPSVAIVKEYVMIPLEKKFTAQHER